MGLNRRSLRYTALCLLLCTLTLFGSVGHASALSREAFNEKYSGTAEHLKTLPMQVGSIGGEWRVIGLSRGELLDDAEKTEYYNTVCEYVKAVGSDKLHRRKSTENSRVILALASIGKTADDVEGYDLLAPLSDYDYVSAQGLNGVIWALIALDSHNYPIPENNSGENQVTRENLISAIIDNQCPDGGWSMNGDVSDPDMTGMALQALAPYRFYGEEVRSAVDRAVNRLAAMQNESAGFNPESCAQVITALCALGINCETDERFVSGGVSLWDTVMKFSVPNGFEHESGAGYNQMATEQVFYAMTAFKRLKNNQKFLYDMTDIKNLAVYDVDGDRYLTINDATYLQRFLAEFDSPLSTSQKKLADLNENGQVDIGDVTLLQKLLAQ